MFALQRAEIAFSYDFMSYIHHRCLYDDMHLLMTEALWGITLEPGDLGNCFGIMEHRYNHVAATALSPVAARFLTCVKAIEAGETPTDQLPWLIELARRWLTREAEVKTAYAEMLQLIEQDPPITTTAERYDFLNAEIDGLHAVDDYTKALVAAIRRFGYSFKFKNGFDVRRALYEFPELCTIPWFEHPDKPGAWGLVTNRGLVWLNGLPIECRPWSVFSKGVERMLCSLKLVSGEQNETPRASGIPDQ